MTFDDQTTVRVEVTNPETPFGGVLVFSGTGSESEGTDTPTGATEFLELTDTPKTYAGHAGKMVVVNADETGLEFIDVPSGGDLPSTGNSRITVTGDSRVTTTGDSRVVTSVSTARMTSAGDIRIIS
jgi:hypothetical protein